MGFLNVDFNVDESNPKKNHQDADKYEVEDDVKLLFSSLRRSAVRVAKKD
jgi:hypothetical protein